MTTGDYNTIGGWQAGMNITEGGGNTVFGYYAFSQATTGEHNVALGNSAISVGVTTGDDNIAIGRNAGNQLTSGESNVFIGKEAGKNQTTESSCVCVGKQAGMTMNGSSNLTAIGNVAGYAVTDGHDNTFVGAKSGFTVTSGDKNVCIGHEAGRDQISTDNNICYIARDNVGPGNSGAWLVGGGSGECYQGNNSSSWSTTSDNRLKKNIVDNNVGLTAIDQLQVRNFEYKTEDEIDRSQFPKVTQGKWTQEDEDAGLGTKDQWKQKMALDHPGTQIGLIAQELEAVLPNCVTTDSRGVKTVDTDEIMWHMLTAIKELSTKVKALEAG